MRLSPFMRISLEVPPAIITDEQLKKKKKKKKISLHLIPPIVFQAHPLADWQASWCTSRRWIWSWKGQRLILLSWLNFLIFNSSFELSSWVFFRFPVKRRALPPSTPLKTSTLRLSSWKNRHIYISVLSLFLSLLCVWHHDRKWKLGGILLFGLLLSLLLVRLFPGWATRGRSTSGLYGRVCTRHTYVHAHLWKTYRHFTLNTLELVGPPGSLAWTRTDPTCVQARLDAPHRTVRTSVSPCDLFTLFIFWLNSKCGFVNLHWFHVPAL